MILSQSLGMKLWMGQLFCQYDAKKLATKRTYNLYTYIWEDMAFPKISSRKLVSNLRIRNVRNERNIILLSSTTSSICISEDAVEMVEKIKVWVCRFYHYWRCVFSIYRYILNMWVVVDWSDFLSINSGLIWFLIWQVWRESSLDEACAFLPEARPFWRMPFILDGSTDVPFNNCSTSKTGYIHSIVEGWEIVKL